MITLYGAKWCGDCRVPRSVFDEFGVMYNYIDLEVDESAATKVEQLNNGLQSIPTIVFADGSTLVEPSREQLVAKLKEQKLI